MRTLFVVLVLQVIACGPGTPEERARAGVTGGIKGQLAELVTAASAIQAAAPTPREGGWALPQDRPAIDAMKDAWKRSRIAYESIEGAIAVLFPEIDDTIDNRYTAFLDENGPDEDLFDDRNVTGNHAIERILWSDTIPSAVVTFESQHAGYVAARFPMTLDEAAEFRDRLCRKMIDDAETMASQFARAVVLDDAAAFRGVIGSVGEQVEKVRLASTSEEESRYSRHTLGDMRGNLVGTRMTLTAFEPWIDSRGGEALFSSISARVAAIDAEYGALPGDAIPDVPAGFDPMAPSAADLQTPYGKLFQLLREEADPDHAGGAVALLNQAAELLSIPQLP